MDHWRFFGLKQHLKCNCDEMIARKTFCVNHIFSWTTRTTRREPARGEFKFKFTFMLFRSGPQGSVHFVQSQDQGINIVSMKTKLSKLCTFVTCDAMLKQSSQKCHRPEIYKATLVFVSHCFPCSFTPSLRLLSNVKTYFEVSPTAKAYLQLS